MLWKGVHFDTTLYKVNGLRSTKLGTIEVGILSEQIFLDLCKSVVVGTSFSDKLAVIGRKRLVISGCTLDGLEIRARSF